MPHELTYNQRKARERVCLPLDNLYDLGDLEARVMELSPYVGLFKIGKGSFTRFGPEAIRRVQDYGAEVFLDLKYHDIPNTVEDAADAATGHEVSMFNVHASGGLKMMEAAVKGARQAAEKYGVDIPKILGVTVLTSIDEAKYLQTFKPANPALKNVRFEKYVDMRKDDETLQEEFQDLLEQYDLTGVIQAQVAHLAGLVEQAGLDGIVCSAADLYAVRDQLPQEFMYVTPGIKGTTTPAGDDQMRVFSPGNAISDGSSILVVGRAITGPETPEKRQQAALEILTDIASRL